MLSNILNLEGVAVLNKQQQESVQGGQTCKITTVGSGGDTFVHYIDNWAEGAAGSAEANDVCASYAISSGRRCFYDCEWDD